MGITIRKVDYPELEGKAVNVDTMMNPSSIVAGCNRDIGITIVSKDDDIEVMCINGPSSPHYEGYCKSYENYSEKYDELFDATIEMINNGEIKSNRVYEILNTQSPNSFKTPSCGFR